MSTTISTGTISTQGITISTASSNSAISYGSLTRSPTLIEDFLERYELNYITVVHKVAAHELLKLKEVAPDYATEIKENLSRNVAREIINKTTFTKRLDVDSDVHQFIGRVWVFSDEELKILLEEAKRVQ